MTTTTVLGGYGWSLFIEHEAGLRVDRIVQTVVPVAAATYWWVWRTLGASAGTAAAGALAGAFGPRSDGWYSSRNSTC